MVGVAKGPEWSETGGEGENAILPLQRPDVQEQNRGTHRPFPPSRQLLGPHHGLPPAATQGQGSPCCLVGWNQHSKAALNRESLLSVWDFPGSVRSQEELLRSVNRGLLNTHLVCAGIWGNHHEQKPGSCPGGPPSPLER